MTAATISACWRCTMPPTPRSPRRRRTASVIGVTDSWMSGRSAYFVEMIAREGLVAIHTASSGSSVAPYGGTRPVLGTNPIAFALPGADGPLVLDMGTSAFMATELQLRARLGQPLPEGVAIDRDGQPTRDANEARQGALLPFGGHKGFGLGLIVQAFGLLGGAALPPAHRIAPGDDGCVFTAFRPDLRGAAGRPQPRARRADRPGRKGPRSARDRRDPHPGRAVGAQPPSASSDGIDIDRLVHDRPSPAGRLSRRSAVAHLIRPSPMIPVTTDRSRRRKLEMARHQEDQQHRRSGRRSDCTPAAPIVIATP